MTHARRGCVPKFDSTWGRDESSLRWGQGADWPWMRWRFESNIRYMRSYLSFWAKKSDLYYSGTTEWFLHDELDITPIFDDGWTR